MRTLRQAQGRAGTRDEAADAGEVIAPGTTLIVRNLATGQDTTFGSVSEIAWQDKGPALAFAITVDGGVGNGLQLFDTTTGVLRTLDSSAHTYSGLAWRKESTSLAALRSAEGTGRDGPTHTLLVWTDVVNGAMKAIATFVAAGGASRRPIPRAAMVGRRRMGLRRRRSVAREGFDGRRRSFSSHRRLQHHPR